MRFLLCWCIVLGRIDLPILLSNPVCRAGDTVSEALKGQPIKWTCQNSCSVLQRGGAGKTSEACNGRAIQFDLPILLSDPACSAREISEALKGHATQSPLSCKPQEMCPPIYGKHSVVLSSLFVHICLGL